MLSESNLNYPEINDRQYFYKDYFDKDVNLFIAKPKAIPQLLESNLCHYGFCGLDIMKESMIDETVVTEIADLQFNHIDIVLATKVDVNLSDIQCKHPIICATEFPNIASEYLTKQGLSHYILNTSGCTEGYTQIGADCIIDICETGETIKANNLFIKDIICSSSTRIYGRVDAIKKSSNLIQKYFNISFKKKYMDIIIGTSNKGKVREIASILMPMGYHLIPTSKDIDETGYTIEANALIKAFAYAEEFPDTIVIAEDSGLVVPSLNNLPGPYSSRFHSITIDDNLNVTNVGQEVYTTDKTEIDIKNNELLLELIKNVPENQRAAYFEVCFVIVKNKEVLFKTTEKSYGFITDEPKGTNGFGYDSIFIGNDTFGKTYAELDNARKNLRSHRKKALQKLGLYMFQNIPNE